MLVLYICSDASLFDSNFSVGVINRLATIHDTFNISKIYYSHCTIGSATTSPRCCLGLPSFNAPIDICDLGLHINLSSLCLVCGLIDNKQN